MKAIKRNKKQNALLNLLLATTVFVFSGLVVSCQNNSDDNNAIEGFTIEVTKDADLSELLNELRQEVSGSNADETETAVQDGDTEHNITGTGNTDESENFDFDKIEAMFNTNYDTLVQEAIDEGVIDEQEASSTNASASYMVRTWTFYYWTRAANGERIKASGSVSLGYAKFPIYGDWFPKLNYVVLHPHYTKAADWEVPTNDTSSASDTGIMKQLAANDALIISPDYEGYGSTTDRIHPYLMHDAISKQCVDMLNTILDWYKNKKEFRGFEKDWDLYTFGYSQGGGQALSIHKYIENDPSVSNEVKEHFRGSFCGAGPYDPVATYEWYLTQKKVSYPIIFPIVLDGYIYNYQNSYLKGYKLEDFLTEPMLKKKVYCENPTGWYTPIEALRSHKYDAHTVGKIIAKAYGHESERDVTVQEVLTPAAQNPESDATKAVLKALAANSLVDGSWTPKNNIIFYHSYQDDVVPIINYKNAVAKFGNKVLYPTYYLYGTDNNEVTMGKHSKEGIWFYGKFIYGARSFKNVKK